MVKEYISRDEMIEQTKARSVLGAPKFNAGLEAAIEVATSIQAADVAEVRHGRWIVESKLQPLPWDTSPLDWDRYDEKTHSEWEDYFACSECHKGEYAIKPRWHFCPECGAKMDGEGNA